MHDGAPTTPAERAVAASLLADARRELGVLVGAGVVGLTSCHASAVLAEVLLGGAPTASEAMTIEAVEQDGAIFLMASRSGRPFLGVALTDAEALRVATQISEIMNRRAAPQRKE